MDRLEKYIDIVMAILLTAGALFTILLMIYCMVALIYLGMEVL